MVNRGGAGPFNARAEIRARTVQSVITALIPFPVLDIVCITIVQVGMFRVLTEQFGHSWKDDFRKPVAASCVSVLLGSSVTAAICKVFAGPGTIVGIVIQMLVSGFACYLMGRAYLKHLESGGTPLTKAGELTKVLRENRQS